MANYIPVVRATDDENYATELWGDDKVWDDKRKQYVPTKGTDHTADGADEGGEESSPGKTSSASSTPSVTSEPDEKSDHPSTARTTGSRSSKAQPASGSARSTGGSGKANE